jgi:hypothetical protein
MEALTAAIESLTATTGSLKSTVDNSEAILMDLVAWKPKVEGAMADMRVDINVMCQ